MTGTSSHQTGEHLGRHLQLLVWEVVQELELLVDDVQDCLEQLAVPGGPLPAGHHLLHQAVHRQPPLIHLHAGATILRV